MTLRNVRCSIATCRRCHASSHRRSNWWMLKCLRQLKSSCLASFFLTQPPQLLPSLIGFHVDGSKLFEGFDPYRSSCLVNPQSVSRNQKPCLIKETNMQCRCHSCVGLHARPLTATVAPTFEQVAAGKASLPDTRGGSVPLTLPKI